MSNEKVTIGVNEHGEACREDGTPLTVRDIVSMWDEWDKEDEAAEPAWEEYFKMKKDAQNPPSS